MLTAAQKINIGVKERLQYKKFDGKFGAGNYKRDHGVDSDMEFSPHTISLSDIVKRPSMG